MSEEKFLLKNLIHPQMIEKLGDRIKLVYPDFESKKFSKEINSKLESFELKQRTSLITEKLYEYLPKDYPKAIGILNDSLEDELPEKDVLGEKNYDKFYMMSYGEYVSNYGLEHFDLSMNALYLQTKRFSSEFPIRFFIKEYPEKSLKLLEKWAKDKNLHVRRLVSEGIRPRLPWAIKLHQFVSDPKPVIRLLTLLKNDPETYVRRSVANNLNDIAKDNPDLVLSTLKSWQNGSKEMNQLTSHALRTLIKDGNQDALTLCGFDTGDDFELSNFSLSTNKIKFGDDLQFRFKVKSNKKKKASLMIDFALHYIKANGKYSPKVFKIRKTDIEPGEELEVNGMRPFRPATTRKFYAGIHKIEIIINGKHFQMKEFELIM